MPKEQQQKDNDALAAVQRRRMFPTRVTQRAQIMVQNRIIRRVLGGVGAPSTMKPPWVVRLIAALPLLQRIPARLVGVGVRPEHVRTPEIRTG